MGNECQEGDRSRMKRRAGLSCQRLTSQILPLVALVEVVARQLPMDIKSEGRTLRAFRATTPTATA